MWRSPITAALLLTSALAAAARPSVERLGPNLYAYISDNDHSSNSTFLIGQHGILVVDTGLNNLEGQKLLDKIRAISQLPVRFIVNTHYHPDHQGGNGVVGPNAVVISSEFTREQTLSLVSHTPASEGKNGAEGSPQQAFRPATVTFQQKLSLYLDNTPVEIISVGPAHTLGDIYVFFPQQQAVATGDLYLTDCSPAMDRGSASNWIHVLEAIRKLPAEHFVPGHFQVGSRAKVSRFRDYLATLYAQVEALHRAGATAKEARERIDMKKYSDFRQYPEFHATFADNAETIFEQLRKSQ